MRENLEIIPKTKQHLRQQILFLNQANLIIKHFLTFLVFPARLSSIE